MLNKCRRFGFRMMTCLSEFHLRKIAILQLCTARWIAFSCTLAFFILLTMVSVSSVHRSRKSYGVVIDAGSSGSRIYIYRWDQHISEGDQLYHIVQATDDSGRPLSMKTKPGLSSFAANPGKAFKSIVPLLHFASQYVPAEQQKDCTLYILGTAGLRLLSNVDRRAILTVLRKEVVRNFNFHVVPEYIDVISGEMEGVYGWMAINYILNRFRRVTIEGQLRQQGTFGFIEMGGASEQIAYEISSDVYVPEKLSLTVRLATPGSLNPLVYHLYVTTFLGFGANSAYQRYFQMMAQRNAHRSSQVKEPCHPSGLKHTVKLTHFQRANLSLDHDEVQLVGTGEIEKCRHLLKPLLLQAKRCIREPCSLNGTYQPPADQSMQFFGFSEYWYCMDDVHNLGGHYSYRQYIDANQRFCGRSWNDIKADSHRGIYPKADEQRIERQCFKAAWLAAVFHDGHHFEESFDKFASVDQINSTDVQWALGAMVYHQHHPNRHQVEIHHSVVTPRYLSSNSVILQICSVIVSFVIIYVAVRFYKHKQVKPF